MENSVKYFNRNGEFYPLVVSYVASVHGLIDLVSRASVDIAQGIMLKEFENLSVEEKKKEQLFECLKNGHKTPLLGAPVLRRSLSEHGGAIGIDIEEFSKELFLNHDYLFQNGLSNYPARMLLVFSYETKKDHITPSLRNDELWQFFRHCRNAAAHSGKFSFNKGEPKHPAIWRGLEIKKEMENSELFKLDEFSKGYMSLGDPIDLLWDIEQKFF